MRIQVTVVSPVDPARFLAALTDFTERRPEIWPGIDRKAYRVHSVTETGAEVTEGSRTPFGRIWARERYDWSTPGVVRWTVEESNFCQPGSRVEATVTPNPEGGSRVAIDWERRPKGLKGFLLFPLLRAAGKKMIAQSVESARI